MSYRSGFQALIRRFIKRFPESEYRYVITLRSSYDEAPHVFNDVSKPNWGGDLQTVTIYHRVSDKEMCRIVADTTFGIRLKVESTLLARNLYLYRRPLHLCFENQHEMRQTLQNKPKFAKLGSSLASQIHYEFREATFPHEANDMINEGVPA